MFRTLNHEVLVTREPGGCALGRELRQMLLNPETEICPEAELFLFLADRAQHVAEVIRPALKRGEVVLCDRYADSTVVYQGYGRGLDIEKLRSLNDVAIGGLWPDRTFVLDMDPADARALRNYLYQMQEQLQYVLTNLDSENLAEGLRSKLQQL